MADVTVPLRVRARLATGVAQAAPWGIALDGLLAWVCGHRDEVLEVLGWLT